MKPTLKSINKALPRFDLLRREYMLCGYTGIAHGRGFLSSAWANLDGNGNVESIRIYTSGDAMERRHYYREDGVVEITEAVEVAIAGGAQDCWQLTTKQFRKMVVYFIQKRIMYW